MHPDRLDRLRSLLRRRSADADVSEELEQHIALRVQDNLAAGMSAAEAREEALRRFGDVEEYRRRTRAIDERMERGARRAERIDLVSRSLRDAVRAVLRRPLFALVTVVTLGVGLGANTAIYTMVERVALGPLPYRDAERLVAVNHPVPGVAADAVWGLSFAGYFHLLDHNRTLEDLGVLYTYSATLSSDGDPERLSVASTTRSLLSVLGARASAGRLFSEEEDRPRGPAVAVLGHGFWVRRFGADAGVVGRTIELDGRAVEVLGVMEPGFELPRRSVDVWMPAGLNRARPAENSHFYVAIGRLREGVTAEAAAEDLRGLVGQFTTVFPQAYTEAFMRDMRFDVAVVPLRNEVVGDIGRALWILLGSVGLVLVIACANIANLFLARGEGRRHEVAIRAALGAGRRELALQHIVESVLLALLAGVLGLALAYGGLRLLVALAPPAIPRLREIAMDGSVLLFTFAISVVAGLSFGVMGVMRASTSSGALREGGRGGTAARRTHAVRGALVVTQVALSVVLLAGAGLLFRSFSNLRAVDPGIDPEGVLAFEVSLPASRYETHEAVNAFYRTLTTALEERAGIERAGVTTWLPAAGVGGCSAVWIEGRPVGAEEAAPCVIVGKTTPGFIESLAMRVRGRTSSWLENHGTGSAVVTRALADRFWPGGDALGKGIRVWGPGEPYYRIVGIVEGVRANLDGPPVEAVYLPMLPIEGAPLWQPSRSAVVLVRSAGAAGSPGAAQNARRDRPEALLPIVRDVLAGMDPKVPVANPRAMEDIVKNGLARRSFTLLLLGIAAGMALLLSIVGLYGVVSYVVGQRSVEIGIRMALGARASQVGAMVLRQALGLAAAGVLLGLFAAFAATRSLRALLFDVSPTDPRILAATSVLLFGVALAAGIVPAWRASRVDPIRSLNAE